jgi:hypothetical protein
LAVSCNNATDPAERANQALRECRAELAEERAKSKRTADLANAQELRALKAESERDTARAELSEAYKVGAEYSAGWSALQAKVARAVALWDASLKARGAQYQIAESEFYEALEALR